MRDWYRLNETRESWMFLVLAMDEELSELTSWRFGAGNMTHLVRVDAQSRSEVSTATKLVQNLRDQFPEEHQDPSLLITPEAKTLPRLRKLLIADRTETAPLLRGFSHIALTNVISAHFDDDLPPTASDQHSSAQLFGDMPPLSEQIPDIEELWTLWRNIVPYLPAATLAGEGL